jgi:uncharacterized tellurite resistance protein B-like protein
MFESIKQWFESLDTGSSLFDHTENESIHLAVASVLHHFIRVDQQDSKREKSVFRRILKEEFKLSDDQAVYLYGAAESANSNFQQDLETISFYIKDKPMVKKAFMEKLMRLISIDGVMEQELDQFQKALHTIFPEIKTK